MENHTDLSFEQLVGMANFDLDGEQGNQEPEIQISLEEDKPTIKEEEKEKEVETLKEPELPKEVEPEITLNVQPTIYNELAKEKLASGEWEDVIVEIDGEEKKLSELTTIDQETYKSLTEEFDKTKKEDLKTKYVSVDGLNETQKALIEIVKSGDLDRAKELFENPAQLEEPFQGYDNNNDVHNEQVLDWYYKQEGKSERERKALIGIAKEDMTLDRKAESIVNYQKDQFKAKIEGEAKAVQQEKAEEQERIKSYRKDLSAELKTEELSDTMVRKFVDVATKYTKDGDLEIDEILDNLLKDPKTAKDLIFFALDKEEYLKKATNNTKKEVNKDILKKINIIRDTSKTTSKKEEEKEDTSSPFAGMTFE